MFKECIEREALYQVISALPNVGGCSSLDRECVETAILEAPTVDVELVKRGEWIKTNDGYECPYCVGLTWKSSDVPKAFKRCPNCGAKMEGEE